MYRRLVIGYIAGWERAIRGRPILPPQPCRKAVPSARPMNPNVIQLRELTKVYRQGELEVLALNHVTLDIADGDFVALMGPSGSGKSTLLHLIAGMDRPTSGACHVAGVEVSSLNETELTRWRREHVGFVFQTFNLIPVLTAFENVELPLLITNLSAQQRRTHVEAALELVGLKDRMNHLPRQLSGGQEQRVAIARAIVPDPKLVLADEPTGNLDAQSATDILELLKTLNTRMQKTVVMVTHDPKAAGYARRSVHLEKGQLR
jgi:putative ABC transport system ATP-binding protein